jgi:ubiquinone/menaquinone biosynthesis C-methylase UbiE
VRESLYQFYASVRDRFAPEIEYSQLHYERLLAEQVRQGRPWLDLGCGHQMLPPWREDAERAISARTNTLVGIDPDRNAIRQHPYLRQRVVGLGDELPFADRTFDLVTANMVVEHLAHPDAVFREVCRILTPGGRFVLHTPNRKGYPTLIAQCMPEVTKKKLARVLHGRREEDVYPTHYRANTVRDLEAMARMAGFNSCQVLPVCSDAILATVPGVGVLELAALKVLNTSRFAPWRPNLLAILARGDST